MRSIRTGLFVLGTMALGLLAPAAQAENVVIRYSNWLPPGYFLYDKVIVPWQEAVTRVTDGRVTFAVTPKAVGTVAGSYDTVADGLADMSAIVPAYTPGRFVMHEGMELPWLGDDPEKRSMALWKAYENYLAPAGDFREIKVLGVFYTNAAHLITTGATVAKVEDFRGMKLRSPNQPTTDALTLLGAVPVNKPISEVYELAAGKMIDGLLTNEDSVVGFKLDDVMTTVTLMPGGMTATTTMIGMNHDTWNRISETDRQAIETVSGEALALLNGREQLANLLAARAILAAKGVNTLTPDDAVLTALHEKTVPVRADWITRATGRGHDKAAEMLDSFARDYDAAASSQ